MRARRGKFVTILKRDKVANWLWTEPEIERIGESGGENG